MGALFVCCSGWGESDGFREIAIKVCESLHKAMGGSEG
jgi:hypothetical protein